MLKYVIGIDEVGRGPIAGPIVAAAVVSDNSKKQKEILSRVKDSKILSVHKREILFSEIIENFIWSVQLLDNNFIDKYGIQVANKMVFIEVLDEVSRQINDDYQVVADYVGGFEIESISFYKKGESKFAEIAAASIIAKVYRDSLMSSFDKYYPHYDLCLHKGYGTKRHLELIQKFGITPIHRKSFLTKYF